MGATAAARQPAWIGFHFDLMCPYAYQTSLWIRDVRERTGLVVNWRFFSLEEVNRAEGKKHPWEREWSYGWSMMRIGALLRREGMDQLDAWYAAAGRALHVNGEKPHDREVAKQIVADLGRDRSLVDAAIADPTTGDEVPRGRNSPIFLKYSGQRTKATRSKSPRRSCLTSRAGTGSALTGAKS